VLLVLLVSPELKETLAELEAAEDPVVVDLPEVLETPVPLDNEELKEMVVFPEHPEPPVNEEVMVLMALKEPVDYLDVVDNPDNEVRAEPLDVLEALELKVTVVKTVKML